MPLGERLTGVFQRVFRSWRFLAFFLAWTAAWWTLAFTIGHRWIDPWPLVGWTTLTTLITQIDVLVVGIGQKQQQDKDSATLAALLRLAEHEADVQDALATVLDELRSHLNSPDPRKETQP